MIWEIHTLQGRAVEEQWVLLLALVAARWVKVRARGPRLVLGTGLEALIRLEASVILAG